MNREELNRQDLNRDDPTRDDPTRDDLTRDDLTRDDLKRENLVAGSEVTGTDVVNLEGVELGKVKDIMVERTGGRIAYVVVARGGLMGMGERLYAVPWDLFRMEDLTDDKLYLDVEPEALDAGPGFDPENWPNAEGFRS